MSLTQRLEVDPITLLMRKVSQEAYLPPGFPVRYKESVKRAAAQCAVKKHFEQPPDVEITLADGANVPVLA